MPVSTNPNPLPEFREPKVPIPEMDELNPPYNYNKKRPPPRKPRKEPVVTIKPIEQYTEEERLIHRCFKPIPIPEVRWDLHYNRIHDKKKRKWYYKLKTGDEPALEVKEKKKPYWEFDTSKWRYSRLAQFMNSNIWKGTSD